MTKESSKPAPATYVDNPHAPEVFAHNYSGFFLNNGNVHITFTASRADHSQAPAHINQVVVGRIVLPVAGAQKLAAGLYDFLKSRGLDPVPLPDPKDIQ